LLLAVWSLAGCGSDEGSNDTGNAGTESGSTSVASSDDAPDPTVPDPSGTGGSGGNTSADSTGGSTGAVDDGSTGEPPPTMTPGCTNGMTLAEGEHTFMLDGYDRRYIARLPQNYAPDKSWPLIFALHGNGGDTDYWDTIGGPRDIRTAFADEAILIIPVAINNAWRDYDAPEDTWPELMELELNFFDTVYEQAKNELCIDTDNVFSMGFSGGGSFSGVLGCRRDYVRAIAVGGSVIYFELEDCTETPAAWITIGDGELVPAREAYRDFFRDHAGCAETGSEGVPATCTDYDGCGPDTPVTFCSHPGDHVWPPGFGTDATKAFFQSFYLAG
jgi:predicted esterase